MGKDGNFDTSKYDKMNVVKNFLLAMLGETINAVDEKMSVLKDRNEDHQDKIKVIQSDLDNATDEVNRKYFEYWLKDEKQELENNKKALKFLVDSLGFDFGKINDEKVSKNKICEAAYRDINKSFYHNEEFTIGKIVDTYNVYLQSVKELLFGDVEKDETLKNDIFCVELNKAGKKLSEKKKREIEEYSLNEKEIIYNFQKNLTFSDVAAYFREKKDRLLGIQYLTKTEGKKQVEFTITRELTNDNLKEYLQSLKEMKKVLDTRKFKDKIFNPDHKAQMACFEKAKNELISRGVSRFYLNSYLRSNDNNAEARLNKLFSKSQKDIDKYNEKNKSIKDELIKDNKLKINKELTDAELITEEHKVNQRLNMVDPLEYNEFLVKRQDTSEDFPETLKDEDLIFDADKEIVKISDGEFEDNPFEGLNNNEKIEFNIDEAEAFKDGLEKN